MRLGYEAYTIVLRVQMERNSRLISRCYKCNLGRLVHEMLKVKLPLVLIEA